MRRTSLCLGWLATVVVAACGGSTQAPLSSEETGIAGDEEPWAEEAGDIVVETGEEPGDDPGRDAADR